jgi:uncharacterized protein involved in exopolysaccharide biosynthesis
MMRSKALKIVLALVLCPIAARMGSGLLPKQYTANMGLLVDTTLRAYEREQPLASVDDLAAFSRARSIQTQIDIITGSNVMFDAIGRTVEVIPNAFPNDETGASRYMRLFRKTRVDFNRESDVMNIRVTLDDPNVAAEVANQIGYAYIDYSRRVSAESGNAALTIINEQITRHKAELEDLDRKMSEIKQRQNVADLAASASASTSALREATAQQDALRSAYAAVRAELTQAEATLRATPERISTTTGFRRNPEIERLEASINTLMAQRAGALEHVLDDHPRIKEIDHQLSELRVQLGAQPSDQRMTTDSSINSLHQQQKQIVAGLRARAAALREQVNLSSVGINRETSKLNTMPEMEEQLAKLGRERSVLENNYLALLVRKQGLDTMESGRQSIARIVSPAQPLNQPSFPDPNLFTMLGLALGVALAALIALPKAPEEDLYFGTLPMDRGVPAGLGVAPRTDAPELTANSHDDDSRE